MWQRRTFHECASELEQISNLFRNAHAIGDQLQMQALSKDGLELLRILALAVRSEQDHGLTDLATPTVGALLVSPGNPNSFLADYVPPYGSRNEGQDLNVRDALNKIAHADPRRAGYRASASVHELLLSGTLRGQHWIAVISVPDLCAAIRRLPDRVALQPATH
jgi:hypothetical protein